MERVGARRVKTRHLIRLARPQAGHLPSCLPGLLFRTLVFYIHYTRAIAQPPLCFAIGVNATNALLQPTLALLAGYLDSLDMKRN
jgi:hypothetical protein